MLIETGLSILFNDPGFRSIAFIPYLIIPVIITIYSGRRVGILSLFITILFLYISLWGTTYRKVDNNDLINYMDYLKELSPILGGILVLTYILSLIIGGYKERVYKLQERIKKLSLESLNYRRAAGALKSINSEFETRLTKSKESITSLYNQIGKLGRLNSNYVVEVYLETIALFTMVERATVWRYDDNKKALTLKGDFGYHLESPSNYLSVENSIEGYVFRNNQFFTIRKIADFQSIAISQSSENIITIPINCGGQVWGVMNIESMPFVKYSRYSEQLIQIITNLTEPYLAKAIEFEQMVKVNDLDSVNNLPFYSQFYSFLDEQLKSCWINKNSLSIIIMEVTNFTELIKDHNTNEVRKFFTKKVRRVFQDAGHDFFYFNYKNSNQLAVVSTNLDFDGVSYYCVKLFKHFNELDHETLGRLELCIGYATQKDLEISANGIINQAEALLNMAKL